MESCEYCGNIGLQKGDDGFYYCSGCGSQAQHLQQLDFTEFQQQVGAEAHRTARQHNVLRKAQEDKLREFQERMKPRDNEEVDDLDFNAEAAQARQDQLQFIFTQPDDTSEAHEQMRANLAAQYASAGNVHVRGVSDMYDESELSTRLSDHMRSFYLEGLQAIIQMQCEALVKDLGLSPLICSIVGPIWVRFVATSRILDNEWAEEAIVLADGGFKHGRRKGVPKPKPSMDDSCENKESDDKKKKKKKQKSKIKEVPVTKKGLRVSAVWAENLKERVPLHATLAAVFLACHIAREPVLPSDITDWATEGVLPFAAAFVRIPATKFHGPDMTPLTVKELDVKNLFRPIYMSNPRAVEMIAAHIAHRVGLELPPVNFHLISSRLVLDLGVSTEPILSHLERLYEWFMPEGLWLCGRRKGFPSRAYVMAMLIVTIKLLYKVDGHSESSLYWPLFRDYLRPSPGIGRGRFQPVLDSIEKRLLEVAMQSEEKLLDYLEYCRDVVYAGVNLSSDESLVCDQLWQCFRESLETDSKGGENVEQVQENLAAPSEDTRSQQQFQQHVLQHQTSGSMDLSIGSAAWSKAPAHPRGGSGDNKNAVAQAVEVEAAGAEQDIASSRRLQNNESLQMEQCRLRMVKVISLEMKRCGFKLAPPKAGTSAAKEESYLMYPLRKHMRRYEKVVHGDYFILLFACARIIKVKVNVLHKVVSLVEEALLRVEERVSEFVLLCQRDED